MPHDTLHSAPTYIHARTHARTHDINLFAGPLSTHLSDDMRLDAEKGLDDNVVDILHNFRVIDAEVFTEISERRWRGGEVDRYMRVWSMEGQNRARNTFRKHTLFTKWVPKSISISLALFSLCSPHRIPYTCLFSLGRTAGGPVGSTCSPSCRCPYRRSSRTFPASY